MQPPSRSAMALVKGKISVPRLESQRLLFEVPHAQCRGSASPRLSCSHSCIQYTPSGLQNAGRQEKDLSPAGRGGKSIAATKERDFFPEASFPLGEPGKPG